MRIVISIFLGLLALFCGGCSLIFLPVVSQDIGILIPIAGFAVAGLCVWGIVRINRGGSEGGAGR